MIQTVVPQVVVEPDSVGPWVALAGVVVGAVLTGGLQWLRAIHAERQLRLRETKQAGHDLLAVSSTLLIEANGYYASSNPPLSLSDTYRIAEMQFEKLEVAVAIVATADGPPARAAAEMARAIRSLFETQLNQSEYRATVDRAVQARDAFRAALMSAA